MSSFPQRQTKYPFQEGQGASTPKSEQGVGEKAAGAVSEAAGAIKEKAQELAGNVAEQAGKAWESTKGGTQQAAHAIQENAMEAFEEVTRFIRRNPVASICGAIALGFLAGFALGPRGSFRE
jgi:ElaB/YqjD/DUF883 family membrane-anchored ribosome-binding protein